MFKNKKSEPLAYIEDITCLLGDTKFEKYFTSKRSEQVKYFPTRKEKFRISKRPCNVLFII